MYGGLISGVGQGAIGFAQLAGAFDPNLPRRNLGSEVQETLGTQADIFRNAAMYQPGYQNLEMLMQEQSLFGGSDPFQSLRWERMPGHQVELQRGQRPPPGYARGRSNVPGVDVYTAADQFRPVFDQQPRGYINTMGDIFDTLGPRLRATQESIYPELTGGLNQALGAARSDFDSGYYMTPAEKRLLSQNLRSSQAARGMGYGGNDAAAESLALTQAGMGLRQQRLDNLMRVMGQYQASMPNTFSIGQNVFNASMGGANRAAQRLVDPFNSYSQDLFNTNFNAEAFEEIAIINNRKEGAQNVVAGAAALGGGGGGGGGMGGFF